MMRSIAAPMSDSGSSPERPILFAEDVHDRQVGPCRLLTLATPVVDVVSWRGSFKAQPDFAAGDDLLQRLRKVKEFREVDYAAGMTILVMPFTFSIAYGIAAGIISYPIVKAAQG